MPQYDDSAPISGMNNKESDMDLDPNSADYQGDNQSSGKKTSFFGKLKDKTKDKVSKIKSKVTKKKSGGSAGDGSTPSESPSESHENDDGEPHDNDAEEEEYLPASVENAPPAPTTPSITEPETTPASTQLGAEEGQTKPAQEFTSSADGVSNGQPDSKTQTPPESFGSGQPKPEHETQTPPETFDNDQLEPEPQTPPESFESDQPEPETQTLPPDSTTRSSEPETKLRDVDTTVTEDPAVPSSGQSAISGYPESEEPAKLEGGDKFEDAVTDNEDGSTVQRQYSSLDQDSSARPQDQDQSFTDKATPGAQGLKDVAYGTVGAAAGALGYDKLTGSENTPQDNTSQDAESGLQENVEDRAQQASDQDLSAGTQEMDQSYTDKAAGGVQGLKDAAYGTVGAAAGALGYDKLTGSENKPEETTTTQDDTPGEQEKAQNHDQQASQQASDQDSTMTTQDKDQSYTDKAAGSVQGLKDAAYGAVAAAAGAVGYDKLAESGNVPQDSNTSQDDDTPGVQEKAEDFGQEASDSVPDTANTVSDNVHEGVAQAQENGPNVPSSATEAVYQAKDAVVVRANDLNNATGDSQTYTHKVSEKADELNNATGDSQTYTEKAAETAATVTGGIAATLGLDKSSNASDGTSIADKTKDYLNSAVDTTKTQPAVEKSKEIVGAGPGSVQDTAGSAADTTKDGGGSAVDTTKDGAGSVADTAKENIASATGAVQDAAQSTVDSSKGYVQTATDSAQNYGQQAVDATKGYTQSVTDISKDYASKVAEQAAGARDTAIDTVTPKDEHKALSDHVTATISNFPAQVKDSVLSTVQGASTPAAAHQNDSPRESGLLGRFTDLLFGKKLPEHDEGAKTTTETAGAPPATEEGLSTSEPTSVQQ